jgi:hypothetical protein
VSTVEPVDGAEGTEKPARTIEDALRELRALYVQRQALQRQERRKSRDTRRLEQLTAQSARRRAPVADDEPAE